VEELLTPEELGAVIRECMSVTARLQATHETLQTEVARLRRELERKDRELERRRRLASLGELAAGVAHEVRNPLGAISLYSGLLRSQLAGAAGALELLDKIEAGIRAIDGVVQDTLALAPRSGKLGRCVLRSLVHGARDVALGHLQRRNVRLEIDGEDSELAVQGDAAALQRVLINLLTNAADASPVGGVVRVRISATQGGMAEIAVSDDGPGLPEDVRERIFDPFFTTKVHGTGLGLTIAHRLVEAHGGRLSAANRPTGGAEFTIALPMLSDKDEPAADGGADRPAAA
ncbi:MAG: hypothetical protein D6744_07095, partial [Planctomycetota bacterium]